MLGLPRLKLETGLKKVTDCSKYVDVKILMCLDKNIMYQTKLN